MKKALIFLGCVALAFVPALSGYVSRPDAWYEALVKPPLQPPNWIFGPVWMGLYLMMGIAHGLFATAPVAAEQKRSGHIFQVLQLTLNAAWSLIFFGARAPLVAGIEILVLLAFILLTMRAFVKVSRPAAYLLVPYVAWVSFATYLNWGVVVLNRAGS